MKPRRKLHILLYFLTLLIAMPGLVACNDNDRPDNPSGDGNFKTSILLYAVASNNLYPNFMNDREEIRTAAKNIDLTQADILVYSVTPNDDPQLTRVVKNNDGSIGFRTLKSYTKDKFSTNPSRISQVINDFLSLSDADKYGLILWSHASGWSYSGKDHIVPDLKKSFGVDQYLGATDQCDIIELADALPDHTFDYIWFDCCYMSAIEVFYQLRNKASYFVACPNELAAEGMPYQITLPLLAKENYNLMVALDSEAQYYKDNNLIQAFTLADASALESVADAALSAIHGSRPSGIFLLNYARNPNGPFYDFGQYTRLWGRSLGDSWNEEAFNMAMEKLVIYKTSSQKNWNKKTFDDDNFSGVSVHIFRAFDDEQNQYYRKLDWFDRIYSTIPDIID